MYRIKNSLPKDLYQGVTFAIFSLGDRAYGDQFCAAGRKLALRLLQLGASLLCDPGYGDDCTPNGGVFRDLDAWLDDYLLSALTIGGDHTEQDGQDTTLTKYHIRVDECLHIPQESATEEWQEAAFNASYGSYFRHLCPLVAYGYRDNDKASGNHGDDHRLPKSRSMPLLANVLVNKRLTSPEWSQNTRHIELQIIHPVTLSDSGIDTPYRAGDVAVILPMNGATNVQIFLDALPDMVNCLADKPIAVENTWPSVSEPAPLAGCTFWPSKCTLRGWLTYCADIHALPEREDLRALANYCDLDHDFGIDQARKLVLLSETAGAALYADYVLREKRSWADVLHDFDSLRTPKSKLTINALFGLIGPIRPREFSIASSPLDVCSCEHNRIDAGMQYILRLHLCVAVVEGRTPLGRNYHGLCSDYLSHLQPGVFSVRLWIRPGSFAKLPLSISSGTDLRFDVPVLYIGAGTGVAPLRGLIREREARRKALLETQHSGNLECQNPQTAMLDRDNILIFGCRRANQDFYYDNEWESLRQAHRLGLLTAFSQDQLSKVYVQQVLQSVDRDSAYIVNHVLVKNGAVYVAGGPRMARAIKDVLLGSMAQALGSDQRAKQYLSKLQRDGHFSIEAWS